MKKMKKLTIIVSLSLALSGCEFMGLSLQEDYEYKPRALNPQINMTVQEFMNSNPEGAFDSLFSAIEYAGLEAEFSAPGRTFFLLHNLAIYRLGSNGLIDPNCYFAKFKVNGVNAARWTDYPVEQVRDLLLYHIVDTHYSYDNLTPDNLQVNTLLEGEKGTMLLRIVNDRDSRVTINDFFGSQKVTRARTSNLLATDGTIHIVGDYADYVP